MSSRAALMIAGLLIVAGSVHGAEVVQWDFNGDLSSSNGGSALVEEAAAPETIPSVGFSDESIGGSTAQVATLSRGTFLRMTHGLAANGGGAFVNRYTLILDVMFLDRTPSGGWGALWQTSPTNANDTDWVVNPDGFLGIAQIYGGIVFDGTWYRLALVVDAKAKSYRSYIDGLEVQQLPTGLVGLDGRFSLDTAALLFADDNQENAEVVVNSVQIRDYPLTAPELEELGVASAGGIPIPTFTCPRSLSCRVDGPAGKVNLAWDAGDNLGVANYTIRRDGAPVATVPIAQGAYTDTPPGPAVYEYSLTLEGAGAASCPHLPLLCRAVLRAGSDLLFDDFENYLNDGDLIAAGWLPVDENSPLENATWTVTNPGGRRNPPNEDGSPSEGNYLISDSDKAGGDNPTGSGMSHDLWSPSFSTTGRDVVWLHFDCSAQMNNNGQCVFDVDVSTDGGKNWANAYRTVAPSRTMPPAADTTNAGGFFGRLHIDLSALAANKPNVMLRWRHFEPSDDWWIAIDDVLVDDNPVVGARVALLLEKFTAGIPNTWKLASNVVPPNAGNQTWSVADACNRSVLRPGNSIPHLDGRGIHRLDKSFPIIDDLGCAAVPPSPKDDSLITPTFDLTKATRVFLHYQSEIVVDSAATARVLLSLDGGSSFQEAPIFYYNPESSFDSHEDTFYANRILEVPEAAGQSQVAFAFNYQSAGGVTYWAVDDVKITVDGDFPIRTCPNREFHVEKFDASSGSVTTRWNALPGDEGFRVLANGAVISGDLPGTAASHVDTNPPAGGSITYSLQSLKAGAVEFECADSPVEVFTCPRELSCCADQVAKTVQLTWTNGFNLSGTGYRITRNGVPVKTVPLDTDSFADTAVPGPGTYEYQLILNGGDVKQCPLLPLKCTATVSGGEFIFSEDFNCYATDDDVAAAGWEIHEENQPRENAQWTITDPGGRGNPPGADGTPTGGKFLVSDSDAACCDDEIGSGMSHDIWSPVFDCSGKPTVWLHLACAAVLNNNGLVVFDIDVTSDGGETWENVFRRVAPARTAEPFPLTDIPADLPGGPQVGNTDGSFGKLDIDISRQAGNKGQVRLRFRQFEPDDDWWIAIDDIVVDTTPVVEGSKVLLQTETFSDGIPDTWTVNSETDAAPWRAEDLCFLSTLNFNGGFMPDGADGMRIHRFDTTFAVVGVDEFCGLQPMNETLLTPSVDCSAADRVFLHFKSATVPMDAVAEVLLTFDAGDTYETEPVFGYQRGGGYLYSIDNGESTYNEYILEVPRAAKKPSVAFAFHYLDPVPRKSYWGIDDVSITAEGGGDVRAGFIRGDCNRDGVADITDAVYNLGFQFLGGETPGCMEACNTDGEGGIDLTDAVNLLSYLFLGGIEPPEPGPRVCGKDPEAGPLTCESPSC